MPVQTTPTISATNGTNAGDYVIFGSYEQDNNVENGPEDIEWCVLDVQNGKALLLSKYALASRCYNDMKEGEWESSSLRNWLNGDFINDSFSDAQKASIAHTSINNGEGQSWTCGAGNDTEDFVFLLSYNELGRYLTDDMRLCTPTQKAVSDGAYQNEKGNCRWWLRSPINQYGNSEAVSATGSTICRESDDSKTAVRPIMWVSSDAFAERMEELPDAELEDTVVADAEVAGIYVPGTYTAEATGKGKVVVKVTVDSNAITAVEINDSGETPELGGKAVPTLQKQVLEAQGPEIDGVAGATLTSSAVRTAVEEALIHAAAQPATTDNQSSSGGGDLNPSAAVGTGSFVWPVPCSTRITSRYGTRSDPVTGENSYHSGIDIDGNGNEGGSIVAADGGTVLTATYNDLYGNYIIIDHGNGYHTLYGHMSGLAVSTGQAVSQGQTIGYLGSTGRATDTRCHFEVFIDGNRTDPAQFFSDMSFDSGSFRSNTGIPFNIRVDWNAEISGEKTVDVTVTAFVESNSLYTTETPEAISIMFDTEKVLLSAPAIIIERTDDLVSTQLNSCKFTINLSDGESCGIPISVIWNYRGTYDGIYFDTIGCDETISIKR